MQDQRVEHWLSAHKLKFQYVERLPLEAVVIDADAKENIRLTDELAEDTVVRYGVALENGADFPGIVVYRMSPNGKAKAGEQYALISGWHRTEAYRLAERKTIPAYVVELDTKDALLISVLRRTANTIEGMAPTMAENIQHGAYLVAKGYTVTDAARMLSLPLKRLGDYVAANKARQRLARMEGTDQVSLTSSVLARIATLTDTQLREVALLSHEARLGTDLTLELARQIRESDDWKSVIEEWRARLASEISRNKGGTVLSPGSTIRRIPTSLRQMERLIGKGAEDAATLRPQEVEALINDCNRAIAVLQELVRHLQKVKSHAR